MQTTHISSFNMRFTSFTKEIEKRLNEYLGNLCDWFIENKLSIHFGEEKTKSILFASKMKVEKVDRLNIIMHHSLCQQFFSRRAVYRTRKSKLTCDDISYLRIVF